MSPAEGRLAPAGGGRQARGPRGLRQPAPSRLWGLAGSHKRRGAAPHGRPTASDAAPPTGHAPATPHPSLTRPPCSCPVQTQPHDMSYDPSVNGSVAASTAGSELDFGGETEAHYTLPSLTDLVRCGRHGSRHALPCSELCRAALKPPCCADAECLCWKRLPPVQEELHPQGAHPASPPRRPHRGACCHVLPLAQLWMETDYCCSSLCALLLVLPVQHTLLQALPVQHVLLPVACRCVHGRPHHCCAPVRPLLLSLHLPPRLQAPSAGVQRPAAAYSHGSGVMWPFY